MSDKYEFKPDQDKLWDQERQKIKDKEIMFWGLNAILKFLFKKYPEFNNEYPKLLREFELNHLTMTKCPNHPITKQAQAEYDWFVETYYKNDKEEIKNT